MLPVLLLGTLERLGLTDVYKAGGSKMLLERLAEAPWASPEFVYCCAVARVAGVELAN